MKPAPPVTSKVLISQDSERDIVFRETVICGCISNLLGGTLTVTKPAALRCAIRVISTTAAQHLHLVCHHFSGIAILTSLFLPFARSQRPFDIHLAAFTQVFSGDFSQTIEKDHAVPFSAFLLFAAGLVFPGFSSRNANVGNGRT